jgi:hypothetical protein
MEHKNMTNINYVSTLAYFNVTTSTPDGISFKYTPANSTIDHFKDKKSTQILGLFYFIALNILEKNNIQDEYTRPLIIVK